jgi:hypothetical protein
MSQAASTNAPAPEPTGVAAWRILLRMLAGFLALFSFAFWAAAGWNTGWTKTQIPVIQTDAVTGIEFATYKQHFAPGLELFVPALLFCLALFAITFLRRRSKS